jgi:hypothetical protein
VVISYETAGFNEFCDEIVSNSLVKLKNTVVSVFTGLYELFEKDYLSDLLALTNTAKRISGNNDILINFNQNSTIAFTNGSFIYLPKRIKNDIRSSQGLVAHESGHIGYGSYELSFVKLVKIFSVKYKIPASLVKQLINVVEDVRINALNDIKFPGFYKNLRNFTTKMLPELKLKMKKSGNLLIYLNLFMEDYEDFQKKPKFRTRLMSDEDWKAIITAKTFLLKTLTPTSSIITIDQLAKILRKYYIKRIVKKIPPNIYQSSQAAYKALNDEEYYENVEDVNDLTEYCTPVDFQSELGDIEDSDFMEDPGYCEDTGDNPHHNQNLGTEVSLLNHYEEFTSNLEAFEKSELTNASEEIIEKLKDSDLSTEDIETLINEVDSLNKKQKELSQSETDLKLEQTSVDLTNDFENLEQETSKEYDDIGILNGNKIFELKDLKDLSQNTDHMLENDSKGLEKKDYISELIKLVNDANYAMEDRLFLLEKGSTFHNLLEGKGERKVIEARIENETMKSIEHSYTQITGEYKNLIARIKFIFRDFRNQIDIDNFQKRGRLNSKFIKTITSDYRYNKCFTKKITQKELKILLLMDISGSMSGNKLHAAKIAMIMLCEALNEIAKLRIVLFTGDYDAINILLKDFDEKPDPRKFDKFGCHGSVSSNLDGISIKHEAAKIEKNVLIIIISDGQPAGAGNYGLYDAIKEIHDVKKVFKVFAFSIDAKGDYLDQLYDKNWILTTANDKVDLGNKLIKFSKLVVKEFFR